MFLEQLPRCRVAIPGFPANDGGMPTWQQRLNARTHQFRWRSPCAHMDDYLPDFSHWDGDPEDPVRFPIAASHKPEMDKDAAVASHVSIEGFCMLDRGCWTLDGGFT